MKLALTLAHGHGETPSDFASRLATRACRDDMREFCRDFGIDPRGIIDGDPEAVSALADLAGASRDSFWARRSPVSGNGGSSGTVTNTCFSRA